MVGQLIMDWSYTDVVKLEVNTFNSTEIMVETSTVSQVLLGTYDRPTPPQSVHSGPVPLTNHHAQEEEEEEEDEVEPPKNITNKNENVNDWFHETIEQFCSYEVEELDPYEEEPEEQKEEVCALGFASVYYDKQTGYHLLIFKEVPTDNLPDFINIFKSLPEEDEDD